MSARRSRMRLTASVGRAPARRRAADLRVRRPVSWDGRWLLLVLRVPEQRRELRHQLTTQLAWAGFGSLGNGLWITPHVDREALIKAEEPAQLLSFRAELGALGGDRAGHRRGLGPARAARALRAVHRRLRAGAAARTGRRAFAAQTAIVHAWRRFPFIDPDLPDDLLPRDWPRRRAYELFRTATSAGRPPRRHTSTRSHEPTQADLRRLLRRHDRDEADRHAATRRSRGTSAAQVRQTPELNARDVPELVVAEHEPLLDSANARPADWLRIARDIVEHRHHYDGFVVLHGTDTMAYTASALAFLLRGLGKPVVVTGSQIPLGVLRSRRAPEPAHRGAGRRPRRRQGGLPRLRLADPARRAGGQGQRERLRGVHVAQRSRRSASAGVADLDRRVAAARRRAAARSGCRWRSTPPSRCCGCTPACPPRCCERRWPSRSRAW